MAKTISDSLSGTFANVGNMLKSIAKILFLSRRASLRPSPSAEGKTLYILGNGPSLATTLEHHAGLLADADCMAVNFFASSEAFAKIRPRYYVLVDPHFFKDDSDPAVEALWRSLRGANWQMTLILPVGCPVPPLGPSTTVATINTVGLEGPNAFTNAAYSLRLGMPRPRNVLIPAIMAGLWLGYRNVYVLGADHSWIKTLDVDDDNRVVSVQPHFYTEPDSEKQRITHVYSDVRLHDILSSFTIAFRAYHAIERWARRHGRNVFNATPGSFIDAFRRKDLL